MKDDRRDELAELLKEPKPNNRHDIWLWLCLDRYEKADLDPATCNGTTMRSAIARYLKRNTHMLEGIKREKDRFMVPDDSLKWIDGGERQYQWLLHKIEDITDLRRSRGLPRGLVHLTGRNHLIAMLDLWYVDIADKADEITRLRKDWLRHKARDSAFEWFEEKEEGVQRCKFAWEWLQKSRLSLLSLRDPISNHQELLMFFDQAEYGPSEQKAIIKEIRQRWSKKQHSERTLAAGKKQVNVELSLTAIDLLDELAKKHDLTRPQVLERLITMESGLGMIEKHFTRHASKEIAAETGSSTPTQPACTKVIIDESPVAHPAPQSQQALEAKPEPSSVFMSDSANPAIDNPVSENLEAQANESASAHLKTGEPSPNTQAATQRPLGGGISIKAWRAALANKEEARRLGSKTEPD